MPWFLQIITYFIWKLHIQSENINFRFNNLQLCLELPWRQRMYWSTLLKVRHASAKIYGLFIVEEMGYIFAGWVSISWGGGGRWRGMPEKSVWINGLLVSVQLKHWENDMLEWVLGIKILEVLFICNDKV